MRGCPQCLREDIEQTGETKLRGTGWSRMSRSASSTKRRLCRYGASQTLSNATTARLCSLGLRMTSCRVALMESQESY
jgi:hypothetical protein